MKKNEGPVSEKKCKRIRWLLFVRLFVLTKINFGLSFIENED